MNRLKQSPTLNTKNHIITEFDAFQDGTLTKTKSAVYQQHLTTCHECQTWVENQIQITRQLRLAAPPPSTLSQAATARIQKNISSRMRRTIVMNNAKTIIGATAAIAVLALIIGFFLLRPDTTENVESVASQSEVIEATEPAAVMEDATDEQLFEAVIAKDPAAVAQLLEAGISPNIVNADGDPIMKSIIYNRSDEGVEIITLLIEYGADVNAPDRDGNALLPMAARGGKMEVVQLLLDAGANVSGTMLTSDNVGSSALMEATRENNIEIVAVLIAHGADVNYTEKLHDRTPLHSSAWSNDSEIVSLLAENGAELNPRSTWGSGGETPLHFAARHNSSESVEVLVNAGADVDIQTNHNMTALLTVIGFGGDEAQAEIIVTILLEGGANPNLQEDNGNTALHDAVRFKQAYAIPLLLKYGADLELQNNNGETALDIALAKEYAEAIEMLHSASAEVEITDEQLIEAVNAKDPIAVEQLLEAGISPNIANADNDPIMKSIIYNRSDEGVEIITLLIEYGADVNAPDSNGNALLPMAARGGKLEVVQLLLDAGADVNSTISDIPGGAAQSVEDASALMEAAEEGHIQVVELLIARGADVNYTEKNNNLSALHRPARNNHAEIVRILIENGADINSTTSNADTPLNWATSNNANETVAILINAGADLDINMPLLNLLETWSGTQSEIIVTLLLEGGANPNLQDENGNTTLHSAARFNRIYAIPLLLEHGADLELQNNDGETALDIALAKEDTEIVEMLQEAAGGE